jgi:hypothetical protein
MQLASIRGQLGITNPNLCPAVKPLRSRFTAHSAAISSSALLDHHVPRHQTHNSDGAEAQFFRMISPSRSFKKKPPALCLYFRNIAR